MQYIASWYGFDEQSFVVSCALVVKLLSSTFCQQVSLRQKYCAKKNKKKTLFFEYPCHLYHGNITISGGFVRFQIPPYAFCSWRPQNHGCPIWNLLAKRTTSLELLKAKIFVIFFQHSMSSNIFSFIHALMVSTIKDTESSACQWPRGGWIGSRANRLATCRRSRKMRLMSYFFLSFELQVQRPARGPPESEAIDAWSTWSTGGLPQSEGVHRAPPPSSCPSFPQSISRNRVAPFLPPDASLPLCWRHAPCAVSR